MEREQNERQETGGAPTQPAQVPAKRDRVGDGVAWGILILAIGTGALFGINAAFNTERFGELAPLMYWGAVQLVYMVPAAILVGRRRPNVGKGISLVSLVAFLINATCFVLFTL